MADNDDALFQCLLEMINFNASFKPILLTTIGTIRTFLGIYKFTFSLDELILAAQEAVLTPTFRLLEGGYNAVVAQYDNLAAGASGIPCGPLDEVLGSLRTQLISVNEPYLKLKKELVGLHLEKAEFSGKIGAIEATDKFLENMANWINENVP